MFQVKFLPGSGPSTSAGCSVRSATRGTPSTPPPSPPATSARRPTKAETRLLSQHLMRDTLERIFYHVKIMREGFLFSSQLRLYCSQLTAASVMSASQIAEITAREKLVHIEKLSGHKTVMIFLPRAAGGNRAHTCLQSRSNLQGQHGDIHALF